MDTLFILFVDAFSFNYINKKDTPFLTKQTCKQLIPAFGFKQLATAFNGKPAFSSDWFTEFYFDPKNSPFHHETTVSSGCILLDTVENYDFPRTEM